MFDYTNYKKEYDEIHKKEIDVYGNYDINSKEYKDYKNKYKMLRENLNKKYNIIFEHDLSDAWHISTNKIYFIDSEERNVVVIDSLNNVKLTETISADSISKIRESISNLFKNNVLDSLPDPPVLDGSSHYLYIYDSNTSQSIEISASNIWYWLEENPNYNEVTDEEWSNLKNVLNVIQKISDILKSNKIKFDIFSFYDE